MKEVDLPTKLVIRSPFAEELKRFYEVYNTGLPNVDETTYERFSKSWGKNLESGNLERLWRVAVLENEIVGVVINSINDALKWGMIWELAVVPEYRDKGIGTNLIAESEQLLVKQGVKITDLAIGVKTHNTRAYALYERLGYGVRFLVVRLKGSAWQTKPGRQLVVREAETKDAAKLSRLVPDAYWSASNASSWKKQISEGDCHALVKRDDQKIVGIVNLLEGMKDSGSTELVFCVKPGYGNAVLDMAMNLVKTRQVDLWLQDNHQDIIDYAYQRGLKCIDSEYLLKKHIGEKAR